jgi:hypothetical protein
MFFSLVLSPKVVVFEKQKYLCEQKLQDKGIFAVVFDFWF